MSAANLFSIRKMQDADLPLVMAIERLSFSNPWHETTFRGEIRNHPISHPYVIVHGGRERVIGYVIYWQVLGEVQVNNIAVHPDFRRMGVGEAVLRQVLDEVKGRGAKSITLEVRTSNEAAVRLYRKLGFRLLGVRKHYYSNPSEDGLVMGLSLD